MLLVAVDFVAPVVIIPVLVVEALALMIAADVLDLALVTVKGPVLEVVALRAEQLAGETGVRVTAQQHAEWIAQGAVQGSVLEAVLRNAQTAALVVVEAAAERKLGCQPKTKNRWRVLICLEYIKQSL